MDKIIKFQGHDFTLREDGVYETSDKFVLDWNDWMSGDYSWWVIAYTSAEDKSYPILLSPLRKCRARILEITQGMNKRVFVNTRPGDNLLGGGMFRDI